MSTFRSDIEPLNFEYGHDAHVSRNGKLVNVGGWLLYKEQAIALLDWLARATGHHPVREGWKMVPVEPTKEMVVAGQDEHDNCIDSDYDSDSDGNRYDYTTISPDAPYRVYRAMLAALDKEDGT